ncbi:MAG: TPM domain-containing protein [Bacillota bacterium]
MRLVRTGRRVWSLILAAALALVLAVSAQPALAASSDPVLPDYTARVNDFTGTLSAEQQQAIESYLAGLEERTGAQGAVALVATTAPLEPVDYKVRLFDKWKPGQKGKDNGFLILVALQERRVEVATGYGLEGVLPDAKVGRILDRYVMPRFKEGDMGGGLLAGAQALGAEIEKDAGLTPSSPPAETAGGLNPFWLLALPVLFVAGAMALVIMAALGMFRPRCPNCGARMLVTDRVVRHATLLQEGTGLKVRRCPRCGHQDEREYVIHKTPPVVPVPFPRRGGRGGWGGMGGMGGSGGWGGFGGGGTGGGGAGRGW